MRQSDCSLFTSNTLLRISSSFPLSSLLHQLIWWGFLRFNFFLTVFQRNTSPFVFLAAVISSHLTAPFALYKQAPDADYTTNSACKNVSGEVFFFAVSWTHTSPVGLRPDSPRRIGLHFSLFCSVQILALSCREINHCLCLWKLHIDAFKF